MLKRLSASLSRRALTQY